MENYKEGYVYHIKDEFFEKIDREIPNNMLMQNKENGDYRPTFYCMKDEKTGLLWLVPMSSRVKQKYQGLYDKQVDRYGSCLKIVIGEFDQKESAFLLQNMFPITEKYLDHVHTRSGKPVRVNKDIQKTVRANMKQLREMIKRGKKVVFTDVNRMEELMLEELQREKTLKKDPLEEKITKAHQAKGTKEHER